ncbi:hypothetical protein C8Q80DRAFT_302960 [Daedaleopsis nitida]|nr:hypothetical protein C8Q80DRAFT_302960 [Daedaleopsis nitida]
MKAGQVFRQSSHTGANVPLSPHGTSSSGTDIGYSLRVRGVLLITDIGFVVPPEQDHVSDDRDRTVSGRYMLSQTKHVFSFLDHPDIHASSTSAAISIPHLRRSYSSTTAVKSSSPPPSSETTSTTLPSASSSSDRSSSQSTSVVNTSNTASTTATSSPDSSSPAASSTPSIASSTGFSSASTASPDDTRPPQSILSSNLVSIQPTRTPATSSDSRSAMGVPTVSTGDSHSQELSKSSASSGSMMLRPSVVPLASKTNATPNSTSGEVSSMPTDDSSATVTSRAGSNSPENPAKNTSVQIGVAIGVVFLFLVLGCVLFRIRRRRSQRRRAYSTRALSIDTDDLSCTTERGGPPPLTAWTPELFALESRQPTLDSRYSALPSDSGGSARNSAALGTLSAKPLLEDGVSTISAASTAHQPGERSRASSPAGDYPPPSRNSWYAV